MTKQPMKDIFNLSGQKAIVMGATGSIGKVCAMALANRGAQVVLGGRDRIKLEKLNEELKNHLAKNLATNLATNECFEPLDLKELERFFARHDDAQILVNSIGFNDPKSILEVEEGSYDSIMDVNLKNAFFQTKYFFKAIKNRIGVGAKDKNASIVHISSQMGHVGGFERSVYCASKHGLEGLVKAASIELGKCNIRINTLAPTFITTPMTKSTLDDPEKLAKILNKISLGRLGELEDLAGAVIYLASGASSLVTGSSLRVDGGWTAN